MTEAAVLKEIAHSFGKGCIGWSAASVTYWLATLDSVRTFGAWVAAAIGLATFISVCFDIERKWRRRKVEQREERESRTARRNWEADDE